MGGARSSRAPTSRSKFFGANPRARASERCRSELGEGAEQGAVEPRLHTPRPTLTESRTTRARTRARVDLSRVAALASPGFPQVQPEDGPPVSGWKLMKRRFGRLTHPLVDRQSGRAGGVPKSKRPRLRTQIPAGTLLLKRLNVQTILLTFGHPGSSSHLCSKSSFLHLPSMIHSRCICIAGTSWMYAGIEDMR